MGTGEGPGLSEPGLSLGLLAPRPPIPLIIVVQRPRPPRSVPDCVKCGPEQTTNVFVQARRYDLRHQQPITVNGIHVVKEGVTDIHVIPLHADQAQHHGKGWIYSKSLL